MESLFQGLERYSQRMQDPRLLQLGQVSRPETFGFSAIGYFLFFGAAMAGLAAATLLWRGTFGSSVADLA
jgi:hypothetical protein